MVLAEFLSHPNAMLVNVVVTVSSDVISLVDDEWPEAGSGAGLLCYDGPREPGAHNHQVVLVWQPVEAPMHVTVHLQEGVANLRLDWKI